MSILSRKGMLTESIDTSSGYYNFIGPKENEPEGKPVSHGVYSSTDEMGDEFYYHPKENGTRIKFKLLQSAKVFSDSLKHGFTKHLHSVHNELQKNLDLDDSDTEAINNYTTSSDHSMVNYKLLNKHKLAPHESEMVSGLDRAISKNHAPDDMVVYSGLSKKHSKLLDKGGVHSHPSFLSTSINPSSAKSFANKNEGDMVEIHVPKGHSGVYVGSQTEHEGEHEFILPRETKLRIHKDKEKVMHFPDSRGKYRVHYATIEDSEK